MARSLEDALELQTKLRNEEIDIHRGMFSFHLLPGVVEIFPDEYFEHFSLETFLDAALLKHGRGDKREEIVWRLRMDHGHPDIVVKRIQYDKLPSANHELRILQRLQLLDLRAPKPLGVLTIHDHEIGQASFLLMTAIEGQPGLTLEDDLLQSGCSQTEVEQIIDEVMRQMRAQIQTYREVAKIDKPWYLKDTVIRLDADKNVVGVTILDWERAHDFDPAKPEPLSIIIGRDEQGNPTWSDLEV